MQESAISEIPVKALPSIVKPMAPGIPCELTVMVFSKYFNCINSIFLLLLKDLELNNHIFMLFGIQCLQHFVALTNDDAPVFKHGACVCVGDNAARFI
jgi:hypothetical protein